LFAELETKAQSASKVKLIGSWRRLLVLIGSFAIVGSATWCFLLRMPEKNISRSVPLSPVEIRLRDELRADVHTLAVEIGERNMARYPQLNAAADFIENSFSRSGLRSRRDTYELDGRACHNIEAEIRGARPEILLVAAHYDSVFGSPGANDNGSGVAAMLALARRFAGKPADQTLRFVAFVNEEPPYFQTNGQLCLRRTLQSSRRSNFRHDQFGNDRVFFGRAAIANLSDSSNWRILSPDG